MLVENQENNHREEPYNECTDGLEARGQEHLTPPGGEQSGIDHAPLNFFRGSVTADRLRHESEAQHGGLAHWRTSTKKQRDYSDQVLHSGMRQSTRPNTHLQAAAIAYGASTGSPGMGLEAENFQSFMTGSHQIIAATGTTTPVQHTPVQNAPAPQTPIQNAPTQQQNAEVVEFTRSSAPSKTRSDLPLQAVATGEIYNYRRKKSVTFTNLLARARSILKA